ncbi:MAG: lamin tail domain-containing protein [Polyangiaceae bacterium]
MKARARLLLVAPLLLVACGPPVPEPEASGVSPPTVHFEPSADAMQVSNVSHIHVSGSSARSLFLFQGTLSSYYLGKLKAEPLPDTLLARQVPLVSWRTDSELVAAPLQVLSVGQYSLAAETGLISEFKVSTSLPVLSRLWPPASGNASLRFAIFCSNAAAIPSMSSSEPLSLEPRHLSVQLAPGVDDAGTFADRCLHFSSDAPLESGESLISAPVVGAWALAPALFSGSDHAAVKALACNAEESVFGLGCVSAADDRALVRTPDAPLLWVVHTEQDSLVRVTEPGAPLVVRGLAPGTAEHLWGMVRDESATMQDFEVTLHTAPARERPILNEALADALGPEPQSEWVELFNDGTLAVDLAQYTFQDGGGRTPLPHAVLAPKSYALLVREDYSPNGSDEPPAASALLVRVPTLGKSGLSNSGERLALVDAAGRELSVLPALSGKPGQSLARRTPASPDDDPVSFSFATPTPGAPNSAPSAGASH